MMNRSDLYDTLDPELLNQAAIEYLDDNFYVEVVLYPDPVALSGAASQPQE
jgi:hypothetical protein